MNEKPVRDVVIDDSDLEARLYVSYFYPDARPSATSFAAEELFVLNPTAGDAVETREDGSDDLTIGGAEILVKPGWLWRAQKIVKVPRKKTKAPTPV